MNKLDRARIDEPNQSNMLTHIGLCQFSVNDRSLSDVRARNCYEQVSKLICVRFPSEIFGGRTWAASAKSSLSVRMS